MRLPIIVELGIALMEQNKNCAQNPKNDVGRQKYEHGKELLLEVVSVPVECCFGGDCECLSDQKLRATAAAMLASCTEGRQVCKYYNLALKYDPSDPYILCEQLAFNLCHTSNFTLIDSARPAILKAIEICRSHVAAGVQIPRAWFAMGRLYLFLRQDAAALEQYAKGIRFYLVEKTNQWKEEEFKEEMEFLGKINTIGDVQIPEITWVKHVLKMGYCLKQDAQKSLSDHIDISARNCQCDPHQRYLIIAGGTHEDVQEQMEAYTELLRTAVAGFEGTIISGGTTAGIPGIIGNIAEELKKTGNKKFRLVGYHPKVTSKIIIHPAYDMHFESQNDESLGLAEPVQMWFDLLVAGVDPAKVRLLGINGGRICRFEYSLALALGALVGIIQSSGRSADFILNDSDWCKCPNLLPLPNDPYTAQAFVQVGTSDISETELETMGKLVHDTYRKGTKPNHKKPNTLPWDVLPEDYKKSSRDQAAYAIWMLRKKGYSVEKTASVDPIKPIEILEEDIPTLAVMEHGRWNYERLQTGWRYASKKDDDKRLSPYLIPWAELADKIRKYDYDAVRVFPQIMATGGYQVTARTLVNP